MLRFGTLIAGSLLGLGLSSWTKAIRRFCGFMVRLAFDRLHHHRDHLEEIGRVLEAPRRVFFKKHLEENDHWLRDLVELVER